MGSCLDSLSPPPFLSLTGQDLHPPGGERTPRTQHARGLRSPGLFPYHKARGLWVPVPTTPRKPRSPLILCSLSPASVLCTHGLISLSPPRLLQGTVVSLQTTPKPRGKRLLTGRQHPPSPSSTPCSTPHLQVPPPPVLASSQASEPGRRGSDAEHRPTDQEAPVPFPVSSHTGVSGPIPIRGRAAGSR